MELFGEASLDQFKFFNQIIILWWPNRRLCRNLKNCCTMGPQRPWNHENPLLVKSWWRTIPSIFSTFTSL